MQNMMTSPRMADRRVLIAALILGAIAAGLIVAFLANASSQPEVSDVTTRMVVVAKSDIPVGAKITAEQVELKAVAESAVIADVSTDLNSVVGVTARYPLARGEQVSASRLVAPPKVQALSFQIPEGMRGFTIPVTTSQSPAALLAPGDFVDLLVATPADKVVNPSTVTNAPSLVVRNPVAPAPQAVGQAVTTLLQNIQVLTVQNTYVQDGLVYDPSTRGTPPEDTGVSYVTLALTPEQAQLVWLASQEGKMTLTLRPFGDMRVAPVGAVQ